MTHDTAFAREAADDKGGFVALWDWRRQVAALYADIRAEPDPATAWHLWRNRRDALFAHHSQSPLDHETRSSFNGLEFFDYDPSLRLHASIVPIEAPPVHFPAGHDGDLEMRPFALTQGLEAHLGRELTLYWLTGYCGGVFLPFADGTSGTETYGAGRYLLDTIKSADLGTDGSGLTILDFNFAYNPSCCYSPRYVCPLAPAVNRVTVPIRGGEQWRGSSAAP